MLILTEVQMYRVGVGSEVDNLPYPVLTFSGKSARMVSGSKLIKEGA